jgi:transposase
MHQSSTLYLGMDVHQDSMAVASVAQDHGAEVIDLGAIGTRPGDLDHLVRNMPSTATQRLFVYAAGPCGDWLYRDLTQQGDDGWVVAPSLLPPTPGDRVKPDRRDARPRARRARADDLTVVYVPTVADEAIRDLSRARDEAIGDRQDAKFRLKAC